MTWVHKRLQHSKHPFTFIFSWYIFPMRMRIYSHYMFFLFPFSELTENTNTMPEEKANIKSINRVWNILGVFPESHVITAPTITFFSHCKSEFSCARPKYKFTDIFFRHWLFWEKYVKTKISIGKKNIVISLHQHPQYSMRVHWYCGTRQRSQAIYFWTRISCAVPVFFFAFRYFFLDKNWFIFPLLGLCNKFTVGVNLILSFLYNVTVQRVTQKKRLTRKKYLCARVSVCVCVHLKVLFVISSRLFIIYFHWQLFFCVPWIVFASVLICRAILFTKFTHKEFY